MTVREVLETTDYPIYYLGAFSAWIYIGEKEECLAMISKIDEKAKANLKKLIDTAEQKARKEYLIKQLLHYESIANRMVIDTYDHLSEPMGLCIKLEGDEIGRYWDISEVKHGIGASRASLLRGNYF